MRTPSICLLLLSMALACCMDEDYDLGGILGECNPKCKHLVCGPDGCGGTCGECEEGFLCSPDGKECLGPCGCEERVCGYDLCGTTFCGGCDDTQYCDNDGLQCVGGICWPDCGDMRLVAGGLAKFGNLAGKNPLEGNVGYLGPDAQLSSIAEHHARVGSFWIDTNEVTISKYADCVDSGICSVAEGIEEDVLCNWGKGGSANLPMNCVSYTQAELFCGWQGLRLPTEHEWERAARGFDERRFPWGDMGPTCMLLGALLPEQGCGGEGTMEVGAHPLGSSPFGAVDMAGNVAEWVSDWWADYSAWPAYDGPGGDERDWGNPVGPPSGEFKVLRGGSYLSEYEGEFSTFGRMKAGPDEVHATIGFRCARDP
jgi:formylglycine-generating enzyme